MILNSPLKFTEKLRHHYEAYFGVSGRPQFWKSGPLEKLNPDFFVLEFPPNNRHNFWIYCSVGMSLERTDGNLIETFIFSPKKDESIVELITMVASFHKNVSAFDLYHTVKIGRSWLENSRCDHCFFSLPYLDGESLELFHFGGKTYHCYWLIPITEKERDFKIENGCEALEQLFEEKQIEYLNPDRSCLLSNLP